MEVTFLTPLAGAFALAVLLPLLVFLERQRRSATVRRALGLSSARSQRGLPLALALVPLLLAAAAAQPVVSRSDSRRERTDAQVFFALDTSRSMLASRGRSGPTRLDRARAAALSLQAALQSVPVGLASFTERVLPHVLPTTDARVVRAVLADSMGIERPRPVPTFTFARHATTLGALTAFPRANYFAPSARKRLLVVFTDGETAEVPAALARAFERRPSIETIFLRFWDSEERVYATGVAERGYVPDPASAAALARVASLTGGRVFSEDDVGHASTAARRHLGSGPTRSRSVGDARVALMPYVTLAAFAPLAFLLRRRNL